VDSLTLYASVATHMRHHYSLALNADFVEKMSQQGSANIIDLMIAEPYTGEGSALYNATITDAASGLKLTAPKLKKAIQHVQDERAAQLSSLNLTPQAVAALAQKRLLRDMQIETGVADHESEYDSEFSDPGSGVSERK
jgi:hypothetical protein